MQDKNIGTVKMRNLYTVFKTKDGYKVSSVKNEDDRKECIEFIPFSIVVTVEQSLCPGSYDLEEIYSYLREQHIPDYWDCYYGRDGRKQKFYLQKILCILIALRRVQWEKMGKKFFYTLVIQCPECDNDKIAGLTNVRPHDLRHTFASHAVNNGFSLPIIAKMLGHKDLKTTQRYAHLHEDLVKKANDEVSLKLKKVMEL